MHRLINMSEIKVTESSLKSKNVVYVYESLLSVTSQLGCRQELRGGKNRYELLLSVPESYEELIKSELEDKISDVIAVNYKYSFFKRNVLASGLSVLDKELLLTSLIAADIDEDKKYAVKKLKNFSEYALDGIFNFRMKPLKEKWIDIINYIPPGFQSGQLRDFIAYLIKDKSGKRVYFDGGNVYDKRYNLLKRRELLTGDSGELPLVKEILLSGAGEIELLSPMNEQDEKYLKEFYGDRVTFRQGYFN